jgi:hypothetical protein
VASGHANSHNEVMPLSRDAAHPALIQQALRVEWLTAAWMLIEAAVAIGSGVAAHRLSLIAFGVIA